MINFFAKSVAATYIWKRYKKIILSTLALFVGYFLINSIHNDYLDYQTRSGNNAQLLFSYAIKWFLLSLVTGLYYYLNIHKSLSFNPENKTKNTHKANTQAQSTSTHSSSTSAEQPDPFAHIRKKQNLRSRADIEMDKRS